MICFAAFSASVSCRISQGCGQRGGEGMAVRHVAFFQLLSFCEPLSDGCTLQSKWMFCGQRDRILWIYFVLAMQVPESVSLMCLNLVLPCLVTWLKKLFWSNTPQEEGMVKWLFFLFIVFLAPGLWAELCSAVPAWCWLRQPQSLLELFAGQGLI